MTARELEATVDQVFAAISDPSRLARWWGPAGFSNTVTHCEFVVGGRWEFTMHGPDGGSYTNECRFAEIDAPHAVLIEHVNEPRFTLQIRLGAVGTTTRVTWVQVFESAEVARRVAHMVVPSNEQNLDRLAREVQRGSASGLTV